MRRLNDLIERIQAYNPQADFDLLRKAYVYSAKVHKGQSRKSGEPYFTHPFEVASVLAELRQDIPTVAAGFLHDTVEDTLATLEEIEDFFGKDVAFLVDGVTKIGKITFSSRAESQAENFRKMLVAMAKDIRVILIKLADRLHNMRTLHHLSTAKQEEISRETQEIYVPLANRLGIMWVRIELEDLALKYMKPQIHEKLDKEMRRFRKSKTKYIEQVVKLLREKLQENGLTGDVSGRIKHIAGIYRKMEARNLSFEQIHDIIAFRIIVDEVSECYEALGVIHALWKPVPGRFKDYIAMPKENLYQSLHTTVIGPQGERVELQIRTQEMHRTAEGGIAAHWKYKEGGKIDEKDETRFRWLRQLLEWQQELKDPNEFMESVKEDLFDEYVYVFTPKGEVKALPRGATPVDFAYAIHTAIGNQCVGAKVGGRIVPLKSALRSGDIVEVLTNKNATPNKDWLSFVASSKARNHIRAFIKKEQRDQAVHVGKELLEQDLKIYGVTLQKLVKDNALEDVVRRLNQGSLDNLYANLGLGNLALKQVTPGLIPADKLAQGPKLVEAEEPGTIEKIIRRVTGHRSGLKIGGHDDVMTTFAKCCNPLPGDDVVGFVTRGRGVTIHTSDCSEILAHEAERRVPVEWDSDSKANAYTVKVKTVCVDKPGLLAKLSRTITLAGVNITGAYAETTNDKMAMDIFTVSVKDLNQLRKLIQRLEEVDGMVSVERVKSL